MKAKYVFIFITVIGVCCLIFITTFMVLCKTNVNPSIKDDICPERAREQVKQGNGTKTHSSEGPDFQKRNNTSSNSERYLCATGWTEVILNQQKSCIFFNMTLSSRQDTMDTCEQMNSTLPLPISRTDDQVLVRLVSIPIGNVYGVWIDAVLQGNTLKKKISFKHHKDLNHNGLK